MAEAGDIGIMMYSVDHYVFSELTEVEIGEKGLLVPLAGNEYRVLKLASSASAGDKVVVLCDKNKNYYAVV